MPLKRRRVSRLTRNILLSFAQFEREVKQPDFSKADLLHAST
jgi:hypothetical protein